MKLDSITDVTTNSYQKFDSLLDKTEVELSFFGTPYLVSKNTEGWVYLSEVVKKWVSLGKDLDIQYSVTDCRSALASRGKLWEHYSKSDELSDRSYNLIVIFSRTIRNVAIYCGSFLGIPVKYMLKSADQKILEDGTEKDIIPVLAQADRFGLLHKS